MILEGSFDAVAQMTSITATLMEFIHELETRATGDFGYFECVIKNRDVITCVYT